MNICSLFNKHLSIPATLAASLICVSPAFSSFKTEAINKIGVIQNIRDACSDVTSVKIVSAKVGHNKTPYNTKPNKNVYHSLITGEIRYVSVHEKDIERIKLSTPNDKFMFEINSIGGSMDIGFSYANAIRKSKGTIVTVARKEASSMASLILFSGTPGYRWAKRQSKIILHSLSITYGSDYRQGIMGEIYRQEDLKPGTKFYKKLKEENNRLKELYLETSSNKSVTEECLKALINKEYDSAPDSLLALQAGWVDFVWDEKNPDDPSDDIFIIRREDVPLYQRSPAAE